MTNPRRVQSAGGDHPQAPVRPPVRALPRAPGRTPMRPRAGGTAGNPPAPRAFPNRQQAPVAGRVSLPATGAYNSRSEGSRGLSNPVGIHLNFALGLSNEVGPPQVTFRGTGADGIRKRLARSEKPKLASTWGRHDWCSAAFPAGSPRGGEVVCERQMTKSTKPVAVDLFSGCGGLTLGLKRAGFRVSVAVENDSLACRTYRSNHRSTALIERDIRNVRGADIVEAAGGHVDLVAGCPPCQGFSTMRTKNGRMVVEDASNELVFEFLRIVTEIQPSMVMLENVPALATDERITQVVAQFEEQGLRCKLAVLNARHFGVPQRRRRMILLASNHSCPNLAAPSDRTRTVRGVIGRLPKPCQSEDKLLDLPVRRP